VQTKYQVAIVIEWEGALMGSEWIMKWASEGSWGSGYHEEQVREGGCGLETGTTELWRMAGIVGGDI